MQDLTKASEWVASSHNKPSLEMKLVGVFYSIYIRSCIGLQSSQGLGFPMGLGCLKSAAYNGAKI